jgi:hypothetical protein
MILGSYNAYALRDLVVTLRKIGINSAQCASGSSFNDLKKVRVQEDNFESFMSDVYNRCYNELGLTPECIGSYITNLNEFS